MLSFEARSHSFCHCSVKCLVAAAFIESTILALVKESLVIIAFMSRRAKSLPIVGCVRSPFKKPRDAPYFVCVCRSRSPYFRIDLNPSRRALISISLKSPVTTIPLPRTSGTFCCGTATKEGFEPGAMILGRATVRKHWIDLLSSPLAGVLAAAKRAAACLNDRPPVARSSTLRTMSPGLRMSDPFFAASFRAFCFSALTASIAQKYTRRLLFFGEPEFWSFSPPIIAADEFVGFPLACESTKTLRVSCLISMPKLPPTLLVIMMGFLTTSYDAANGEGGSMIRS
mmetsp:Transcript_17610/g.50418  ORF Transcript_17610/g.50418 Transcript_17610/m.50418 type:complete len:285 (-) Transcript_17610:1643-2497(-)